MSFGCTVIVPQTASDVSPGGRAVVQVAVASSATIARPLRSTPLMDSPLQRPRADYSIRTRRAWAYFFLYVQPSAFPLAFRCCCAYKWSYQLVRPTMPALLDKSPSLTSVFDQLLDAIVAGRYPPGARLPAERDLAQ